MDLNAWSSTQKHGIKKSTETLMDETQPVVMENKGFDTLEKPALSHFAPFSVKNASDATNRSQYDIYEDDLKLHIYCQSPSCKILSW